MFMFGDDNKQPELIVASTLNFETQLRSCWWEKKLKKLVLQASLNNLNSIICMWTAVSLQCTLVFCNSDVSQRFECLPVCKHSKFIK